MSISATAAMKQLPMRSSAPRWPVARWYMGTSPGTDLSGGTTTVALVFPVGIYNIGYLGVKTYHTSMGPGQASVTIDAGGAQEQRMSTYLKIPNGTLVIPPVLMGHMPGRPFTAIGSTVLYMEIENLSVGQSPIFFAGGMVWDLRAEMAIGGPTRPGTEVITVGFGWDVTD